MEVVLGMQFEPLEGLRTIQLGGLWRRYQDRYPKIDERPPLDPRVERFSEEGETGPTVELQLIGNLPLPRMWFLSSDETRLIQVQRDRFIHNWRRLQSAEAYPRYSEVRRVFEDELRRFQEFLDEEEIGPLRPNQCEVTYVNTIVAGVGWSRHGQIERIFKPWRGLEGQATFLPELESATVQARYVIPDESGAPLGRFRVSLEPSRSTDGQDAYLLRLSAQGRPTSPDLQGVMAFLDIGHEWVVRGFVDLTTSEMQRIWRRIDGGS